MRPLTRLTDRLPRVWYSPARLREMYSSGRPDAEARRANALTVRLTGTGLMPARVATLEVRGRRSGRPIRLPAAMADVDGRWYLVSMLGECNWTRNVRAAGGHVVVENRRGGLLPRTARRECVLTEVEPAERAPVLARYVQVAPGGRPHIPVPPGAPLTEFAAIADRYPIFAVDGLPAPR